MNNCKFSLDNELQVKLSPYLVKITTILFKKKLQLTKNLLKSTTSQIIDWISSGEATFFNSTNMCK